MRKSSNRGLNKTKIYSCLLRSRQEAGSPQLLPWLRSAPSGSGFPSPSLSACDFLLLECFTVPQGALTLQLSPPSSLHHHRGSGGKKKKIKTDTTNYLKSINHISYQTTFHTKPPMISNIVLRGKSEDLITFLIKKVKKLRNNFHFL